MASGNSREITTSQVGVHDKLDELVTKYRPNRPTVQSTSELWVGLTKLITGTPLLCP